jgi:hypothetical protein
MGKPNFPGKVYGYRDEHGIFHALQFPENIIEKDTSITVGEYVFNGIKTIENKTIIKEGLTDGYKNSLTPTTNDAKRTTATVFGPTTHAPAGSGQTEYL